MIARHVSPAVPRLALVPLVLGCLALCACTIEIREEIREEETAEGGASTPDATTLDSADASRAGDARRSERAVDQVLADARAAADSARDGMQSAPSDGNSTYGADAETLMLGIVNDLRRRDGVPPLVPNDTLLAAADGVLGRVLGSDDVDSEISVAAVEGRLKRDGYTPRLIVLAYASFSGSPSDLFERWPREDPATFERFTQEELRHFAVAEGLVDGVPTYLAVAAVSLDAAFAPQLAALDDIGAVRLAVLRATNAARSDLGRPPLVFDKSLEVAAQLHAEDMIDRDYFSHFSPEGVDVLERAEEAGYRVRYVAENLASGQLSVDEVVDGWLKSPGHRKNLLSPQARELGVGFALERDDQGGYEVVWVQVFGASS